MQQLQADRNITIYDLTPWQDVYTKFFDALTQNNIYEQIQSGFIQNWGTETY